MPAETHLSELCRGSDIDAITARLRQVAPLDESPASDNISSGSHPDRYGLWGYRDNDGRTAFHWAVALKNFDLARALMSPPYNSPALTEDEEWTTPFATACSVSAPVELLQEILDRCTAELAEYAVWKAKLFPPEVKPGEGYAVTAPESSSSTTDKGQGNVSFRSGVRGVLIPHDVTGELGVSAIVNSEDATGLTPLLFAAGRGHLDVVRFLVEHGADLNHQSDRGQSALHRAVYRGNIDLVEYLVTASQRKNGTNKAAQRRFMNLQDSHGDSALFYASMDNNEEIGSYLLRHGSDRELRNKNGKFFWEV
ncbi:hypothetical protein ABL78_0915 [Leptomonas seymouri]|uniref:Uncharacterized protein n=1 Tax=Leptomonas seymouri TaxID=5684 RepID=A0A0N0P8U8_LEPSE|nr:hypothetical protein ABL78_0915 [Leptomonas seymouri]|eukprot:KPI89947.1 hypothetical protein ABL78_0915 [Leptomonas seymouri]